MKVLYDHQAFTYQEWGGVSKSFCELLLHRPQELEYEIAIKESDNIHLKESHLVSKFCPATRTLQSFSKQHSILGREKIYNFLGKVGLLHTSEITNKNESIRLLQEGNFDIFHPTFFDDYFLPYLNGKPFVITVHDLMPELFGWRKEDPQIANKPELLERAAAVIAVSENTKKDLCRLYNVPEEKVHVIHHGHPSIKPKCSKNTVNRPYFLFVGRRDGYKNSKQTICDFGRFHQIHPNIGFVFTGAPFSQEEEQLLKEHQIFDCSTHLFATNEQLAALYENAIAFIFPSLYEGFGMPILEAFGYECPVLLNNKSCFPEIGGNAAIYFDSIEGQSNLPEQMELVLTFSERERNEIKKNGVMRLREFSWYKSASLLLDVYNSAQVHG